MSSHAYRASSTPGVVQRVRSTRTGRKLERSGYVTAETVAMWVAYVLTLVGNAAIEGGRLGGVTSATVAYDVYTWFTPAGYVFAIWSLIYVALAVWLVVYTRSAPTRPKRFGLVPILFVASCALNVLWLALWHFQLIVASTVVIVALWAVLFSLYLRVRRHAKSPLEWAPISIYAAWVTVATLANLAILFTRTVEGVLPFFSALLTVVVAAAVLAFGYVMRRGFGDAAFPLVFLWALVGVGVHVAEVSWLTAGIIYVLCFAAAIVTFVPFARLRARR